MYQQQFMSPVPAGGQLVVTDESRLQEFRACMEKHEIGPTFATKLRQLEGFHIVMILDDSGSMATPVDAQPGQDPYAANQTRWSELQRTSREVVEIAGLLDRGGVDCHFLNRQPVRNVTPYSLAGLDFQFQAPPAGYTPMRRTLQNVLTENRAVITERKLLIIIATDGIPTDERGQEDKLGLRQLIMNRENPKRCPITIAACTDEDEVMKYLQEIDEHGPQVDVCDDYLSEKKEILKAQGKSFKFSRGDWICKLLLGAVDPEMDKLDEPKGCCNVM